MRVQSLGQEDSLEKEMATHSSVLVWRSPWTEEPDELLSTGLQKVRHDCFTISTRFPGGPVVKNPPANAGDAGSILGSGRSPERGNGNPLQYSWWDNPMDRGDLEATVHEVTKS